MLKLKIPLKLPDAAHIVFTDFTIYVMLLSREPLGFGGDRLMLKILCRELNWQILSLA
jgi:hypothetical protein